MKIPSEEVLKIFEWLPDNYLVLSPDLIIQAVSNAYLTTTGTTRENITGRNVFQILSEGEIFHQYYDVYNLRASLETVQETHQPHRMAVQPYQNTRPGNESFETRYWLTVNTPVLHNQGEISYIIHKLADVSEEVLREQQVANLTRQVTEQAEWHQKLEASQSLLNAAEEVGHVGSYEFHVAGNSFCFSNGLYRLFGEEPQSFTPTLEIIDSRSDPEDALEVRNILKQAITNKKPYFYSRRILRADNSRRTLESQGRVICDESGKAIKLVGLVQDITERKQTAETIQQMLNGSISAITIMQAVRNEAGNIIDFIYKGANQAAETFNKMPAADMLNKGLLELFPGIKETFFDAYVQVVETGEPLREQSYYPHEHFDHWFDVSAVKNGDGLIMTFHDLTEQKKAEKVLHESKNFIEEITLSTPDLITIHDADTNQVIYANQNQFWAEDYKPEKLNKLYQLPDTERAAALVHPEDMAKAKVFLEERKLLADGEVKEIDLRMQGKVEWVRIRSKVFKRDHIGRANQIISFTSNITGNKKIEKELQKNKDQFEAAINVSPLVLSILKSIRNKKQEITDFYLEWVSKRGEELVGLDATGRQLVKEFPSISESGAIKKFIYTVETGDPTDLEYSYPKDEQIRWVRWRAVRFGDGLFVSVEDITDRKKSEEALRDEHRRLKESQAIGNIGSYEWDAASDTIYWSDEMYRIHGLEPQQEVITFDKVVSLLHPEDLPWVKKLFLTSRQEIDDIEFTHRIIRPDGEVRYLFRRLEARTDAAGKIISLTGTAQDITEQKKTEQDILKHLTLLQQAEELGNLGSWEYQVKTKTFGWSEGMYRLFGLAVAKKAVSLKTFMGFIIPEDRRVAEKIRDYLQYQHVPFDETLRIQVRNQVFTLKTKAAVLRDDQGEAIKILGIILDVSEVKRLEKENLQMRLKQQKSLLIAILEAQEEERRRISESLHNGVGQLLYATQLHLDLVKQQYPPFHDQKTQHLNTAYKFLTDAIQETRRVSHELVPMILRDFGLRHALQELCNRFSFGSIQFECEVDGLQEKLEPYLEVVLYRISQEVINNIVKHAGASQAKLLLVNEDNEITLKVRDNGRGIKPAPGKYKGIGLPSIIDRVKLLNGSISITTPDSGRGTLINIKIPLSKRGASKN